MFYPALFFRISLYSTGGDSVAPDLVSPGVICLGGSCLASAWAAMTFATLQVQPMCGACVGVSSLWVFDVFRRALIEETQREDNLYKV